MAKQITLTEITGAVNPPRPTAENPVSRTEAVRTPHPFNPDMVISVRPKPAAASGPTGG